MIRKISIQQIRKKYASQLHSDHHYMTLAACEVLPAELQARLGCDVGLLVRYFCEIPDTNHAVFHTLGAWEMFGEYHPDTRRDMDASILLDWNPVTKKGQYYGHAMPWAIPAVQKLIRRAYSYLKQGQSRRALACIGAAAHYIEDVVTFPQQQTIHRHAAGAYEKIRLSSYKPKTMFTGPKNAKSAIAARIEQVLRESESLAPAIRETIRQNQPEKRRRLYLECYRIGAAAVADLLVTMLPDFPDPAAELIGRIEAFPVLDAEGMPPGYLINRPATRQWVGCATVEGDRPRALDMQRSNGHMLTLSATGESYLEWRQATIDAMTVKPGQEVWFEAYLCGIEATGTTVARLEWLSPMLEIVGKLDMELENDRIDWQRYCVEAIVPNDARFARFVFRSENNRGCALLDEWKLIPGNIQDTKSRQAELARERDVLLKLMPSGSAILCDASPHAAENEPIVSLRKTSLFRLDCRGIFNFDGKGDFIEIPRHPQYCALQPDGALEISMEIKPQCTSADLICAANHAQPQSAGYRIAIKRGKLVVMLYHPHHDEWICQLGKLNRDKWNTIVITLRPNGCVEAQVNDKKYNDAAPFQRIFPAVDVYIGSDFGVRQFYYGGLRNFVMREVDSYCE